jgi:hypothetical protein
MKGPIIRVVPHMHAIQGWIALQSLRNALRHKKKL